MARNTLALKKSIVHTVPIARTLNGSVTYFHSAVTPVILAPGNEHVIALAPEFITPQDGHDKQDCEQAAAKRWITAHAALV